MLKCSQHPTYIPVTRPTNDCRECWRVFGRSRMNAAKQFAANQRPAGLHFGITDGAFIKTNCIDLAFDDLLPGEELLLREPILLNETGGWNVHR